ncbi:MAG TPA: signal recognition particle-docking protein FtsY [Chloroflexia bacterium]|nr:signal recognition particle-docking protein FtsY [Chloroflexia bacterium]
MFKFFRRNKEAEKVVEEKTEQALEKTRSESGIFGQIGKLFDVDDITDEFWDSLERLLLQADIGFNLTEALIEASQRRTLDERTRRSREVETIFRQEMVRVLGDVQNKATASVAAAHEKEARDREWERRQQEKQQQKQLKGQAPPPPTALPKVTNDGQKVPYVIMVVGVNGSGKTTSIAKLAAWYQSGGAKVVLGAADTFRAGAIDQLKLWGERINAPVIARPEGSDPASVAFDTVKYAQENDFDIAIIDTAGRLQSNFNLMGEMKKIERTVEKAQTGAPNEILLVLDANTGQNGLSQAKHFTNAVGIDGIILTKLDGTAKGGIAFAIVHDMKIPIKYIGTGEKVPDFAEFEPETYVNALFQRR